MSRLLEPLLVYHDLPVTERLKTISTKQQRKDVMRSNNLVICCLPHGNEQTVVVLD